MATNGQSSLWWKKENFMTDQLREAQENWHNAQSQAWEFLSDLQRFLSDRIPAREEVAKTLKDVVTHAKLSPLKSDRSSSYPEGAFLNHYVIPLVHEYLKTEIRLSEADSRRALLSESYRSHMDVASGTPVRSGKHPFSKKLGASPNALLSDWQMGSLSDNSCPDMALRTPCPTRVVFEAKYFRSGGSASALASGVYECFFYRGLPYCPAPNSEHGDWDYVYACFLAYDATPDSILKREWDGVDENVKKAFWQGANIFVMLLP
jgi:hypothetical protein